MPPVSPSWLAVPSIVGGFLDVEVARFIDPALDVMNGTVQLSVVGSYVEYVLTAWRVRIAFVSPPIHFIELWPLPFFLRTTPRPCLEHVKLANTMKQDIMNSCATGLDTHCRSVSAAVPSLLE